MKWVLTIKEITPDAIHQVGGKAAALVRLSREGLAIPPTLCIPTSVYQRFLAVTGLKQRIMTELNRKPFDQMRWEEIWDSALRIRNMFLTTPLPDDMADALTAALSASFNDHPVAVRSSAPGEDGGTASFAGLHDSYLNLRGTADIITHVRLVWASLWSDAALLYRKELALDIQYSAMAVLVQGLVAGRCSGVFFGVNPIDADQSVIEAVYGLNQGLVDGRIAPDRWIFERASSSRQVSHAEPERRHRMIPGPTGVITETLPDKLAQLPPLTEDQLIQIISAGRRVEDLFGAPQDVEWTFAQEGLVILQSRPITSGGGTDSTDKRTWYLSLHRSFENLKELEKKITRHLIPEMTAAAQTMAAIDLKSLNDQDLAVEIQRRHLINDHWVQVYWKEFIPFAHGMRLFGQFYNDAVQPEDPYEFMRLLEKNELISLERNRMLTEMAQIVGADALLRKRLETGGTPASGSEFEQYLNGFIDSFGDLTCPVTSAAQCRQGNQAVIKLVLALAENQPPPNAAVLHEDRRLLQVRFLDRFDGEQQAYARDLLELARSSYKLRDDDNIYLGHIEAQLFEAIREAQFRLEAEDSIGQRSQLTAAAAQLTPTKQTEPARHATMPSDKRLTARQIVGQPAGPGLATGVARVIRRHDDLFNVNPNEILICDAVDPNMTFIIPLVAGVVERRGGMLIHGAIIAREYGIPCVTGVPDATKLIRTGEDVTVDGYLGIVTLGTVTL